MQKCLRQPVFTPCVAYLDEIMQIFMTLVGRQWRMKESILCPLTRILVSVAVNLVLQTWAGPWLRPPPQKGGQPGPGGSLFQHIPQPPIPKTLTRRDKKTYIFVHKRIAILFSLPSKSNERTQENNKDGKKAWLMRKTDGVGRSRGSAQAFNTDSTCIYLLRATLVSLARRACYSCETASCFQWYLFCGWVISKTVFAVLDFRCVGRVWPFPTALC